MNQQYTFSGPPAIENRKLWIFTFRFAICVFQFSLYNFLIFSDGWSADRSAAPRTAPTLARLSFWLSPDRMGEFETTYREKLVPILKNYGLKESSERGRPTVEGVFSRLFEARAPSEIPVKNKALGKDDAWIAALKTLGSSFGRSEQDGLIRHSLHLYAAPGAPPRVVPAGLGEIVSAGTGRGHWRTYDVTDGLADVNVQDILQDREGALWFATSNGVSRYDGRTWTNFTTRDGLVDNRVYVMFQDRDGVLWFGTWWGGVSRYDPLRLRGPNGRSAQDTASTSSGQALLRLSGTKRSSAPDIVLSIIQDRDREIWFGTTGGVGRYDGKSYTTFTKKDGLADNYVVTVFEDRDGFIWFGTKGGGVSRYDGKKWETFTTRDGLANNYVTSIFQDSKGYLWFGFGTERGGVSRYDGKKWKTFTTRDGLADNYVTSIFQDSKGYLWFGTEGGGLSRYAPLRLADARSGQALRLRGKNRRSAQDVASTPQHKAPRSLSRARSRGSGQSFTIYTTKDGLGDNRVETIFEDREGVLWVGTQGGGVSRFDGTRFSTFTTEDGLANNVVRSIFQDREGHLWFCTGGGLSQYSGPSFTSFAAQDGLGNNQVETIFEDWDGILWIGTDGSGVSRYDGVTFTRFTVQDGLANNEVRSIFQDRDGVLWFGTRGGMSRYDGQAFTTFTTQDGLANNVVRSMVQDREGHLWFGTYGGGVSRYDGNDFQTMDLRDGLAGNQVLSVIQDRNGNLWFGTYGGLTRYRQPPSSAPLVSIEAVVADRRYEAGSGVAIPSSVNLTAFEFKGISFKTRAESMVYRYRLKGYDEAWKSTRARRMEYPDLLRGHYTFEVRAVDRDLVPSDRPASVAMRIRLPYERIAWVSALGIAIGLIAWQTTRVVHRGLRLREGEARFRGLSEATSEGIAVHEEGKILDANRALATMFGYESSEIIGKTAAELTPPEYHQIIYQNIQSGYDRPYEVVGLKKDGSTFPIEVIGRTVPYRGRIVRVTAIRDLTDRRRAEEERAKLDEQLQQLRYLYRLRSAMAGGRSPEEIIRKAGESVMEVLSVSGAGGALIDYDARTYKFGETEGENLIRYKRPVAWGERERGALRLFCSVKLSESQERALLDETAAQMARALEARDLELQLLESARLVSLGQMAAGVAHEMNQPLGAISATTEDYFLRLREGMAVSDEQWTEMLKRILGMVDRMSGTVEHLRTFSRDSSEERGVRMSVKEVIQSGLGLIGTQLKNHGIDLHTEFGEDVPEVRGHPRQLEQVFLNLIGNARDALDEAVDREMTGGRQTVKAQIGYDESRVTNHEPRGGRGDGTEGWAKRLIIRTRRDGDDVVAEVEDNGVGIDEPDVGRVFEPFFTTKEADKGTGLGLSISYAIVKNHGGEIVCESRKGEGSVFRVRLPGEERETANVRRETRKVKRET